MFERYKVIHFIGIGGIGMSGIAEVLFNLGYVVTGSDLKDSQTTERLRGMGMKVHTGHHGDNVDGAHVVVISSAVKDDNPEVREAVRRGVPVIPRAEMLAELGRLKYALLVAGSHGKTTTTSLLSTILAYAGSDPTVVIGGRLKAFGTNARLGRGEFMVAEADESDGSFLKLNPTIGVVTNIDQEHMDYFKTMTALKEAFLTFMNKVPFYGLSVLCIDDENVRSLLPGVHRRVLTYGFSEDAELRAEKLETGFMAVVFVATLRGEPLGKFSVPVAGRHNVLNTLAAIGVALQLRVPVATIQESLAGFEGIQRRLELKGEAVGVRVYDDYGHHPTEISATLKAARESFEGGRLLVLFQPHRYTRTQRLMDEFVGCFEDADEVVLMEIYPAGEKPIKGVNSSALMERMGRTGIKLAPDSEEAVSLLVGMASRGDMVITLGAGDVYKAGEALLERLKGG
jgi:UDP-N-acetylmuramate--alanine ligase